MTQRLTQSQTFDAGKLRMAAEQKKDESILLHIRGKEVWQLKHAITKNATQATQIS